MYNSVPICKKHNCFFFFMFLHFINVSALNSQLYELIQYQHIFLGKCILGKQKLFQLL